jgi:uncharacterized membrane protein
MPKESAKRSEDPKKLEDMKKEIELLKEMNELQQKNNALKAEIAELDRQLIGPVRNPEPGLSTLQPIFRLAIPIGLLLFVIGVALNMWIHAFAAAMAFVVLGAILIGMKLGLEKRALVLPDLDRDNK